jgi:RNA polymerase sigma-70 factor (ECF subfamily)
MTDGPAAGLAVADAVAASGALDRSHRLHATRGELLRRCGRIDEAVAAYRRALQLVGTLPERRFLEARLSEVDGDGGAGPSARRRH